MDGAIVRWLNDGVGRFTPLDRFMEAMVSDYLVPLFGSLVLIGLWFYGTDNASRAANQVTAAIGIGSIGVANLIVAIVNALVWRSRPVLDNDLTLLFYRPTDSSFPSNAAGVGFAVATAVFLRYRRIGLSLYALAFLWGFGRVYAGVHYPSDVIVGALIGVAAASILTGLFRLLTIIPRYIQMVARWVYLA